MKTSTSVQRIIAALGTTPAGPHYWKGAKAPATQVSAAKVGEASSKTCTSYSLKPTTIPLAPPLVEVNGEVLKTLADRTVPFCTDGRSLYRPRRYLPHLSWAISLSGWVGWALKICPPFQGVFFRNGNGYNHAFQDRFVYNISELNFLQKHLRCFCYKTGISLAHIIVPRPSLRVRALATP